MTSCPYCAERWQGSEAVCPTCRQRPPDLGQNDGLRWLAAIAVIGLLVWTLGVI